MLAQFGMVGLGTMGLNLVLNIADNNIAVVGYDRDPAQQQKLSDAGEGKPVQVARSMKDLVESLATPRKIMLLVPAGKIVDMVIDEISPLLAPGDIIIDGGNSHFIDTNKRIERLAPSGVLFMGMGVSGGEEGARLGPSLMPGGNSEAYAQLKPILEKIAAQHHDGPCVAFIGNGSSGHFTKMVHNGIEYAMMQLISEVYGLLKEIGQLDNAELQKVFSDWNKDKLQSFLIEITAIIFHKKDPETGKQLVDMILDKAKQKGTGMWTSQSAMELNVPLSIIDAAVSMRYLSAMKDERIKTAALYKSEHAKVTIDKARLVQLCSDALQFGFLLSYAQGLHLLTVASSINNYQVNIAEIIRVWKGGCIIRSAMLNDLQQAYLQDPTLVNIIHSPLFTSRFGELKTSVVELVSEANKASMPVAALSAALQYFVAYSTARLPANLVQAQRDFFGAHTYERIDIPGTFHAEWIDKPAVETSEQKPKQA